MSNLKENFIIAVDGPAGSGKSTVSKIIAKKYNLTYLDTGAMYRMVALYFLENKVKIEDDIEVEKYLNKINLDIKEDTFILNNKDVSKEIRTSKVAEIVSQVASKKIVRQKLVNLQREIAKGKKVILDGRDIGSVVFPNANLKIFLIAKAEERAKRRLEEYLEKGIKENYEDVLNSILNRDKLDSNRSEGPLVKTKDALEIDTTHKDINEVCHDISNAIDLKIK